MITRFHFHQGQCDFRQRWARTDKWKLERAAIPIRMRFGLHGNWAHAADIGLAASG